MAQPTSVTRGPSTRTVLLIGAAILVAILILAMIAAIASRVLLRPDGTTRADHVVTAPVDGRQEATFDLVSGATSVTVRGADLGDRLFRAETPAESRQAPTATVSGDRVQLHLRDVGGDGPSAVEVQLNRSVRWQVRFTAGATTSLVDLRDVSVTGVEFISGMSSIELRLPKPSGTVPVRMSGGAGRFAIQAPAGVPVRVRAGGGAGQVTVDGVPRSGLSGGTVITPEGWDSATARYDVDNSAGVATLTVDRPS
jgi:hypothetical protein